MSAEWTQVGQQLILSVRCGYLCAGVSQQSCCYAASLSSATCLVFPCLCGNCTLSFCAGHKRAHSASAATRLRNYQRRDQDLKWWRVTTWLEWDIVGNNLPQEAHQLLIYQQNLSSPCWEASGFLSKKPQIFVLKFALNPGSQICMVSQLLT